MSRWTLSCFAAVNSADDLPLGELEGGGIALMRWGNNRWTCRRRAESVLKSAREMSTMSGDAVMSERHDIECDDW